MRYGYFRLGVFLLIDHQLHQCRWDFFPVSFSRFSLSKWLRSIAADISRSISANQQGCAATLCKPVDRPTLTSDKQLTQPNSFLRLLSTTHLLATNITAKLQREGTKLQLKIYKLRLSSLKSDIWFLTSYS